MSLLPDNRGKEGTGVDESGLDGVDEVTSGPLDACKARGWHVAVNGGVKIPDGLADVFHVANAGGDDGFLIRVCLLLIHG